MLEDEKSSDWTRIVAERKIKDAIDEGVFNNLPGSGKPLDLEDDTVTPQHLRAAHRIMRNAGVAPEWILLEREIDLIKGDAQAILKRAQSHYSAGHYDQIDSLRETYRKTMKEANDMILKYNVTMPFIHRGPIPFRIKERLAEWDDQFRQQAPGA